MKKVRKHQKNIAIYLVWTTWVFRYVFLVENLVTLDTFIVLSFYYARMAAVNITGIAFCPLPSTVFNVPPSPSSMFSYGAINKSRGQMFGYF